MVSTGLGLPIRYVGILDESLLNFSEGGIALGYQMRIHTSAVCCTNC